LPYAKLVGETRIIHNSKGADQFTKSASDDLSETELDLPF